jgi:hypothetical protein
MKKIVVMQYAMALAVVFLLYGCKGLTEDEPIPSYIHISKIDLEVKPDGTQGSNAHDIVDAWVYADKILIGLFELPVTIPIIKSGNTEITVFAGIKRNGRTADRVAYPLYTPFVKTLNLIPKQIDTLQPKVGYKEGVKFPWIEDFEDQSLSLEKFGNNATIDTLFITNMPIEVFQYDGNTNNYSGLVKFNGIGTLEHANINAFEIPKLSDVYLEVNYKCDVNVEFGFFVIGSISYQTPVVLAYPTTEWKKMYLGFTEDYNVSEFAFYNKMKVYVKAINANAGTQPKIYFDNLKLVHF